jgi:hypothetical protein
MTERLYKIINFFFVPLINLLTRIGFMTYATNKMAAAHLAATAMHQTQTPLPLYLGFSLVPDSVYSMTPEQMIENHLKQNGYRIMPADFGKLRQELNELERTYKLKAFW